MKMTNLSGGILFILGGMILLCFGLLTDAALDSMLIGFAAGAIFSGLVMTCRYFYWSMPENEERYQEKIEKEEIEFYDELKTKLRDKSGRYAYAIGLVTVSVSIAIFSVLGELKIVENSRLPVLYLGGYLAFQIVAGIVIFNQLLKKYE